MVLFSRAIAVARRLLRESANLNWREPTMTANDLIRENLELVATAAPDLTARFYERLFRLHPALQGLFGRRSEEAQQRMLLEAIVAVVDHLEDASWLDATLRSLGAKHVEYGVRDEMYPLVGGALLETLADVSGEAWTPETAQAWSDAIGFIAGTMIAGAERARQASAA